jgi:hypothetical protein
VCGRLYAQYSASICTRVLIRQLLRRVHILSGLVVKLYIHMSRVVVCARVVFMPRGTQVNDLRDFDVLMKLATCDSVFQSCMNVVLSTCLAHGIEMECDGFKCSKEFDQYVQRYYVGFCEQAIRCMFVCGFVPWRVRRGLNKMLIPETLPMGSFTWSVCNNSRAVGVSESACKKARGCGKLLSYKIKLLENMGVDGDRVNIFDYIQPACDSIWRMGSDHDTIQTPMSSAIESYRRLVNGWERVEHADEWNTQGKLVCSYSATTNAYSMNEGNAITNDWGVSQNRSGAPSDNHLPTEMDSNVYTRDAIVEGVVSSKPSNHVPTVYTLPKNTKLESLPTLQSSVDTAKLRERLDYNIASVMGVPYTIVAMHQNDAQRVHGEVQNTRLFLANMQNICRHVGYLLDEVYKESFPESKNTINFRLRAAPRIEIGGVGDLVQLSDAGLLAPGDAIGLAGIMIGINKKTSASTKATKLYKSPGDTKKTGE